MSAPDSTTRLCCCWAVTRTDGQMFGFTDHDRDLYFEGVTFLAGAGLTAIALQQTTGLAIDNTEALGALSTDVIQDADIQAGLFDGAEVRAWLVPWDDVDRRELTFRGAIGEITRQGSAFTAELRGLTELLGQPRGRVYHRLCPAVLGDGACKLRLEDGAAFVSERRVLEITSESIVVAGPGGRGDGWFDKGRLSVLTGKAAGATAMIRSDRRLDGGRALGLWVPLAGTLAAGDRVRLVAGCDRRFETCRDKFGNAVNFQGFPHIPGEDWLMAVPRRGDAQDGGSLFA